MRRKANMELEEREVELYQLKGRKMNDRRLIAVELADRHIDILQHALNIENEDYLDTSENVADSIVELIELIGEMM